MCAYVLCHFRATLVGIEGWVGVVASSEGSIFMYCDLHKRVSISVLTIVTIDLPR